MDGINYVVLSLVLIVGNVLTHVRGQQWSGWSDWSAATCKGSHLSYARTRMCNSPSIEATSTSFPSTGNCMMGQIEVQNRNSSSASNSCVTTETAVILGVVSFVTLLFIIVGVILSVMCLRVWIRRTAYNVRQARELAEQADNSLVYHNFVMNNGNLAAESSDNTTGADIEVQETESGVSTVSNYIGHNGGVPPLVSINASKLLNATKSSGNNDLVACEDTTELNTMTPQSSTTDTRSASCTPDDTSQPHECTPDATSQPHECTPDDTSKPHECTPNATSQPHEQSELNETETHF